MDGRSILILAPHPDDEVVGCAGAIGRARQKGASIHVLYLTTGVPAREVLWPWQRRRHPELVERRREEALAASRLLGIEPLDFRQPATRRLRFHLAETKAAIEAIVASRSIDTIWVPAYEGGHQDHDTANFIAGSLSGEAAVWEFAEYNFADGRIQSQIFHAPNGHEITLELTAEEISNKRAALALYWSERGNLGHVGTGTECFRPLDRYDYTSPPHPGTLFYQRFQWVPFRHPRIDFTRPEQVSESFAAAAVE